MERQIIFNSAVLVTPSSTVNIAENANGKKNPVVLYIGNTGNVRVLTADDEDVLFSAVPAGTTLPIAVKRVFATNTTSTIIVALR